MEHSLVSKFDMPVAVRLLLISLLEICSESKKPKIKGSQINRLQKTYKKFCISHLILIQKFDISVLDIHHEWKD